MNDTTKEPMHGNNPEAMQAMIDGLLESIEGHERRLKDKQDAGTFTRRELDNARRLFMDLYEEHRSLKLRFGWLEETARDAVNACEKHEAANMDRLRDELGLEMRGD